MKPYEAILRESIILLELGEMDEAVAYQLEELFYRGIGFAKCYNILEDLWRDNIDYIHIENLVYFNFDLKSNKAVEIKGYNPRDHDKYEIRKDWFMLSLEQIKTYFVLQHLSELQISQYILDLLKEDKLKKIACPYKTKDFI